MENRKSFRTTLFQVENALFTLRENYQDGHIKEGEPDTQALQSELERLTKEVNSWLLDFSKPNYSNFDR